MKSKIFNSGLYKYVGKTSGKGIVGECVQCKKLIKGSSSGSTSNFLAHIRTVHSYIDLEKYKNIDSDKIQRKEILEYKILNAYLTEARETIRQKYLSLKRDRAKALKEIQRGKHQTENLEEKDSDDEHSPKRKKIELPIERQPSKTRTSPAVDDELEEDWGRDTETTSEDNSSLTGGSELWSLEEKEINDPSVPEGS